MGEFNFLIWLGEKIGFLSWITPSTIHIASAGLVAVTLILFGAIAHQKLKKTEKCVVPSSKFTVAGLFDAAGEAIVKFIESMMGDQAIKFLPLIGTLFLYIFFCNLLSLIPGFIPPTDNTNTNLPCALVVFFYYHFVGIKEHGLFKYLKHMAGPIIWLAPILFVIEMISHCVRPISLSVRLFGNITGDHMVLGMFSGLIPEFVPVIFLFLALFVAFIQAFVFSLLSTVYIALAAEHEEH